MPMITANKLEDLVPSCSGPCQPRALMVASVPELTMRTISMAGKASTTACASSTSASQGAP